MLVGSAVLRRDFLQRARYLRGNANLQVSSDERVPVGINQVNEY